MQRSEVDTLHNLRLHLRGDEYGFVELLTTMDYAVADGIDLLEVLDATDFRVHQFLKDELDTHSVFRHGFLEFYFLAVRQFDQEEGVRQTDLLDAALRHHGLALHLKELIFNTATTAV